MPIQQTAYGERIGRILEGSGAPQATADGQAVSHLPAYEKLLSLAFPRNFGDAMPREVQWPRVPVRRERVVVLQNGGQGAPARGENERRRVNNMVSGRASRHRLS